MDNGITWVQGSAGAGRTMKAHALRTSNAKMKLTPDQQQARRDISLAFDDQGKGFGYAMLGAKTAKLLSTGGGHPDFEGQIDASRKRIGRMHEWKNYCFKINKRGYVFSVEAIERYGGTATSYAEMTGFSRPTIVKMYKGGLDEYAKLYY